MLQKWQLRDLTTTYLLSVQRQYSHAYAGIPVPLYELYCFPVFLPFPEWSLAQFSSCSQENNSSPGYNFNSTENFHFEETEEQLPFLLHELLRKSTHTTILGEAGTGKTTLLHYLLLGFANPTQKTTNLNHELDELRIPIMSNLSEFPEWLAHSSFTLLDAAANSLAASMNIRHDEAIDLLESWQQDERLLLMMDGMNELPPKQLETAHQKIRQFIQSPAGQNTRLILTSRPDGFTSPSHSMQVYTLLPFPETRKNHAFLANYLAALHSRWAKNSAQSHADKILEQIKNTPALQKIEQNPLLLRMTAEIYETNKINLPADRAHLIERWLYRMYTIAGKSKIQTADFEQSLENLEEIAASWQKKQTSTWENQTVNPQGDSSDDRFTEFKHVLRFPLVRDYFMAKRLARAWRNDQNTAWHYIKPRLHLPEWREVILLMSSLLQKNEQEHFTSLVIKAGSKKESILYRDLALTLKLKYEGSNVSPENENKITQQIRHDLLADNISQEQKEHLLHQITVPLHVTTISLLQTLDKKRLSDHNKKKLDEILPHICQTLGKIGNRTALEAMLLLLHDPTWVIRQEASTTLGQLQKEAAILPLIAMLQDTQIPVRYAAAAALGMLPGTGTLEQLTDSLKMKFEDEDERFWLAIAIQHIQSDSAMEKLITCLEDQSWIIRFAAAGALGNYQEISVIRHLIGRLLDEDADVRRSAAGSLAKIREPHIIRQTINLLRNGSLDIRRSAAVFLGEINTPATVKIQISLLADENWYVRCMAAESLGKMQAIEAVPLLINMLQDEEIRRPAAEALGNIKAVSAVKPLMALLHDDKESVRLSTAIALSKIQDPYAGKNLAMISDTTGISSHSVAHILQQQSGSNPVPSLLILLHHDNWFLRASAALALSRTEHFSSTSALLELLDDAHWYVRFSLASALANINDPSSILSVARLLKDSNIFVRYAAEEALNRMQNEAATPFLILALADPDEQVRRLAACALETAQSMAAIEPLYALLQDNQLQESIRRPAARALAHARNKAVIPCLLSLIKDDDRVIRQTAARGLALHINFNELLDYLRSHPEVLRHLQAREITTLCNAGIFINIQTNRERKQ